MGMAWLVHREVPRGVVVDPPLATATIDASGARRLREAARAHSVGTALPEGDGLTLGVRGLALSVSVWRLTKKRDRRIGRETRKEEKGTYHCRRM